MTFDEWWESLTTREQNSADRELTKAAWEVSAMLMKELVLDFIDECPGLTVDQDRWLSAKVRALGD